MPVVDITEAAASTAMFRPQILGGHHLDRAVPLIEDRLKLPDWTRVRVGPGQRAGGAGARGGPDRAVSAIVARRNRPSARTRPRSSCSDAAWPDSMPASASTGVPVVDGVAAAVTIAESLVRLGLTTSKVRTYAAPRPKTFKDWPPG